jgi:hypothetical protein
MRRFVVPLALVALLGLDAAPAASERTLNSHRAPKACAQR